MTAPSPTAIRPSASNPKDGNAYNDPRPAYEDKGDYDRAIADYDQAIRLDPKVAVRL